MTLPRLYLASNVLIVALCVAAAVLLNSCAPAQQAEEAPKIKAVGDRKAAPPFSLKDAEGKTVKLSDYKGKVVLLNFWATFCGPCKIEIPWFIEFEQKYKDRGFAVLGIAMDEEGWEIVRPYIKEENVNYRILMGDEPTSQMYGGVENLPTTFVLDADGKIVSTHVGLVSKSVYENEIEQLLSKKASASGGVLAAVRSGTRGTN